MQVQRQIDELLAHRASEWLELLPTASEAEKKEFAQWLSESRLHVQAFLEIAEIEHALHGVDRERHVDLAALLSQVAPNVVPLGRPPPVKSSLNPDRALSRPPIRRRAWLRVAGSLAACASIAAVALIVLHARSPRFSTEIGEQRTVELADTSVMTLNALSEVEVHIQKEERDIELRSGEALFTVAHDPKRPFKVHTRAGTVQAVGTQFNVYDKPNGDTRVSVLEGRVLLTPRSKAGSADPAAGDAAAATSELLVAGEEADIRMDGSISKNEKAVVANTVAWRQRRLVFDNTAIEEMVIEFNRYNPALKLRLDGVPLQTLRYTGIFDAADPDSFIALLSRESDLIVERHQGEVVLKPRTTAQ